MHGRMGRTIPMQASPYGHAGIQTWRYAGMETWRHTAAFPQSAVPVRETGRRSHKGTNPARVDITRPNALTFQCLWKKNLFIWPFPPRRAERAKPRSRCWSPRYLHYVKGYDVAVADLRLPAALHRRDAAARPEAGPGRQPLQGAGLRTVHAPRQESLSGRGEQHGTGHRRRRAASRGRPRSTSYSSTCPARSTIRR